MKKTITCLCVLTIFCSFIHAEEPQQQTKEPSMQTPELVGADQEATQALKKLEDISKDETLESCPIKMADEAHTPDDKDVNDNDDVDDNDDDADDYDDYDFDDEEDDEEEDEWDEDDEDEDED